MGLSTNGREGRDRLQTVRWPGRLGVFRKQEALASQSEVSQLFRASLGEPHFAAACARDLDLVWGIPEPGIQRRKGETLDQAKNGRVFRWFPLLPAPRLRRVCFQVGSHFHLQVSDKPRQAPALPDSVRWGRAQGGNLAPTRVGSRTAIRIGFLAFRP